ncbi:MAG: glycoside hydrolase family 97 protein, partial [Bacteroidales bacterium]|nr:glycoside hydrolase family 97 protein [Bacteroidales bacterium]
MKKIFAIITLFALAISAGAKDFKVSSPSGDLKVTVSVTDSTRYTLEVKGITVLKDCAIAMELEDGRVLGVGSKIRKDTRGSRTESIVAPLYRQASFDATYNYIRLSYDGDYILQFRAYNDGVAYRFVTSFASDVVVKNETVEFNFADKYPLVIPMVPKREDRYETSFEACYTETEVGHASEDLAFLPCLVRVPGAGNLMMMESDVEDYPGIFVKQTEKGLTSEFPPVPLKFKVGGGGAHRPDGYSDVIARTKGSRSYPWRIVAYAPEDKDLPTNNMVYQTASPSKVDDVSWITPGHSTWDWWNASLLWNVPFKSGINTETYKYHIDFAENNNIEYVIVDDGWYKNFDPMQQSDEIDIKALCDYARESNVKLILWMAYTPFVSNAEAICEYYSKLGVYGFKIDFFDGQYQTITNQVYDMAEITARYRLIVDFHGLKPSGLNRTYPNVVNFEGVFGLENCKWSTIDVDMPRNQVSIPYLRMAAAPIDFTQGAMRNGSKGEYAMNFNHPMSMGTRACQIAMYIVYDSPLVMLCDSPSAYLEDQPTLDFIMSIPTVFESTEVLEGKLGEYIVTKREKDGKYYVGAMTNWEARDLTINLDFLPQGEWLANIYRDGKNADTIGKDHKIESFVVSGGSLLSVHLAPG